MRQSFKIALCMLCCASTALAFEPTTGDYTRDNLLHVRLLSYNTQRNFIADPSTDDAFNRILVAVDPDVIVFQEIETFIAGSTIVARLNAVLPPPTGGWQVLLGESGGIRNVVASRFPMVDTRTDTIPASSTRGVTIARIDLPDGIYSDDIYVLGVHLKAFSGSTEDAQRQQSVDAIANWLGDARDEVRPSGDNISLPTNTPMIVLGDFNLVGPSPQPELTLTNGDIQNEGVYGPDVKGDWDISDMGDLMPADPFTGDTDTWPSDTTNPFSRLDRFIYTDSSTVVANSFILNTLNMTPTALAGTGLLFDDTDDSNTADHLPIVMDIEIVRDCNENAIADDIEIAEGTATDCNNNSIPDECESLPDCNNNQSPDLCDLTTGASVDCNGNAIPDECENQTDCNDNSILDICDIAFGISDDCNNNAVPDVCELAAGSADDCNANDILDTCEPDEDCNVNGTPDICDIALGTSIDCDGNQVPDACELDGDDNTILLEADFENEFPPLGWSADGFWNATGLCPRLNDCDPSTWAYFGQPSQCNFDNGTTVIGELSAPIIVIPPAATSATLTYCSAYNGEGGNANVSGFDWAYVTVDGAEVDDVGADGVQNTWEDRTVDLTAFIGQSVSVEWRFDSRDGSANSGLGWQVDQIELSVNIPADRDCNLNGILDTCDIAQGTGTDCNADGVLDQCSPDCNANNNPDVCDAFELIQTQPQDQEHCAGDSANFSVTPSVPTAIYQWSKDSIPLIDGGDIIGAGTPNLTISNVQASDEGDYRCVIIDGCIDATTDFARLTVVDAPAVIVNQSVSDQDRCADESVTFTVFASGSEPIHYEWRKDGADFGAIDSPTLTLLNLSTDDSGEYDCFVSNGCGGELSSTADLAVGGGVFTQHPVNQCAETGATVVLTSSAIGSGYLSAWLKDDVAISDGGQFSGASTELLTITNVTPANAGVYKALAYNLGPFCVHESNTATLVIDGCQTCTSPGDLDADGDVDLADAHLLTACFDEDVIANQSCQCANIETENNLVDLADWLAFVQLITGP